MKSFLTSFSKTKAFSGILLKKQSFLLSPRCFSTRMTVRQALNRAHDEEMARDESVFVIGEEVAQYNGAYKITEGLLKKYGAKRVIDTPITEMGFTGIAGAAMNGLRPICEFMSMSFSLQSIDHIINSAAKLCYMTGGRQKVPVVFRGINGAAKGVAAQHTQDLTAWYASVPGLKVFAPYDAEDALGMLRSAVRDDGPVVLLENELLYGRAFDVSDEALAPAAATPFGKARVMRKGGDVTVVAHSRMVDEALTAAELLAKEGVAVEVLNLRCLRPLDVDAVFRSVRKTNRLVTVEEGWPQCGIGAEICAAFNDGKNFYDLDAPIERVTGADIPTPYAASLEIYCTPTAKEIVKACRRALNKK